MSKTAPSLLLLVMLSACASMGLRHADGCLGNPGDSATGALHDPLAYAQYVDALSGEALHDEYEAATQTLNLCPSDANRLRVALVLGARNAAPGSEHQALVLLSEVTRNADGELAGLASLMASQLTKQLQLEQGRQVLRGKLRTEEARAAALQEKLDALKAIEQHIQQRQSPSAETTK